MNETPFMVGDSVYVSELYRDVVPESPVAGRILTVCEEGEYLEEGEVPIEYEGEIYYVPLAYVSPA